MRCDFLIEAVGNIYAVLIDEAENFRPERKNRVWIWAAVPAACLLLFFGAFAQHAVYPPATWH